MLYHLIGLTITLCAIAWMCFSMWLGFKAGHWMQDRGYYWHDCAGVHLLVFVVVGVLGGLGWAYLASLKFGL